MDGGGAQAQAAARLADWVRDRAPVVVLSGAGLSTESGIPDYRGATGATRTADPMTYQTFTRDAAARRRYWARSFRGWRLLASAVANDGHRSVAVLQRDGWVDGVITQNVDGLHQSAGAEAVTELHGSIHRVTCLACGELSSRRRLDRRLREANRGWDAHLGATLADGDVDVPEADVARFREVGCESCGGVLKPDVVFFGETVPAPRVASCFAQVEAAGGLLVLGSSLTVMSGYRFVLRAAKHGTPVAVVNQGPTRGDAHAQLRLDAPLGSTLSGAAAGLSRGLVAAAG